MLTGGTVQDPFVLEVWGQPEPDIPASTSAVNFSDAVGGAVIDLEAGIYMVPSDAEDGAGFRDTGVNYPVGLRSGGMITFTASADTPTTLSFRLTGDDSVGEVSELYHEITIDSSEPKAYEVSLQPGSTSYFSELVMSVIERDAAVAVSDVALFIEQQYAGWVPCPTPADCDAIDWSFVVDEAAPDGAIELTFNAPADLGAGIYFGLGEDRTQRLDLTDYYNGYINFDVYFDEAPAPEAVQVYAILGCWSPEGGYECWGGVPIAMQHSGWQSFSVPIADLQAAGADLTRLSSGFELELYAMGDGAPASISFRVANVELIAERVVDEAPVLLDAEWYSKNFDFEAWLEAEQPEIPVLQTTSRRMVLEPAMQGEYGHAMMMHETLSLTGVS